MDIKNIQHQKEILEKRIFKMIKDFENKNGLVITDIDFWCKHKDGEAGYIEDKNNLTLTAELTNDTERVLVE